MRRHTVSDTRTAGRALRGWRGFALRASFHFGNLRSRSLVRRNRLQSGHRRIYFFHIRKTGGTSLNSMFLGMGGEEPSQVLARLASSPFRRAFSGGKVFVGWNRTLIRRGDYFYAFSHFPAHQLTLPDATFTLTCLRDPAERVISHYRMLCGYRRNQPSHQDLVHEGEWLGEGFSDFLDRVPREHLLRQLYMFSPEFDVGEAAAAIVSCDHVFFQDSYDAGIEALAGKLGLELRPLRLHRGTVEVDLTSGQRSRLRAALDPEYELLARVRKLLTLGGSAAGAGRR